MRRFQYEAQLLARLRHPNIAQIYEASTHDDGGGGVPYFAMEYIPGAKPITQYAREHKLSTNDRLQLFTRVCAAVHHGHQKGVIHRDLKPSNILVDADGEPKIIDFGVARSTDSDLALTTLQTDVGQLVGTLQYMSPEQCEADPDALDTRSDVYALGIVLYQLLCEALPYDVTRLALHEAARVICDEAPLRPSHHSRRLRGDIETISLKALAKERGRRYQSAADLSRDIEHYLKNEPIAARPPSAWYQLRKFSKRNRALFVGILGIVLVALLGAVVSLAFALRESEQRQLAEARENEARAATILAKERAEAARFQAENAQALTDFFIEDLLSAVAPSADPGRGRDVPLREVLDEAARRIDGASAPGGRFADRPLIEASVRAALGHTYRLLGEPDKAERHLKRARVVRQAELGDEHQETLQSFNDLGNLYYELGRYVEAEELYRRAYRAGEEVYGLEDPTTLSCLSNLASVHRRQGKHASAEELLLKALEVQRQVLGESHANTLGSMNNLANVYWAQGRYGEAEALCRKAAEVKQRSFGPEHPSTLISRSNLASICERLGRLDEAEAIYLEVLSIRTRILGDEHPNTLNSMSSLATVYRGQGRLEEAEALLTETLAQRTRALGKDHPDALQSMNELAAVHILQKRYDEAEPLLTQALEARTRVLGAEHPRTLQTINDLASLYGEQERPADAEPLMLRTYQARKRVLGEGHPDTILSMANLGLVYASQQKYMEAEVVQAEAVAAAHMAWPEGSWIIGALHAQHGKSLLELDRFPEAEASLGTAHEVLLASVGPDNEYTASAARSLIELYERWHRAAPDDGYDSKALEWREIGR
ncbi:MAG: tetratricopeptide repeat protein, partial [Phycisphaerales bacterium JB038]